jgi:hypothetical protein
VPGLEEVRRGLAAMHKGNDKLVVEEMSRIFSGILEHRRARHRAEIEADAAELFGDGKVAILRVAWGTPQIPATAPSKVSPEDLARAVAELLS